MPDDEPASFCVNTAVNGLAFSGEQSKTLEQLNTQHYLRLYATTRKLYYIYTDEQNKASRDAMLAARNAGKTESEVLQAGRDAVKLTEEQQTERKALLAEIISENRRLEAEVMAALTNEQRAQLKERRERLKPYVDYGRYFR
jgi:acyl-CoA reductase-like NAD-dependent aldehyde dehydrogenase